MKTKFSGISSFTENMSIRLKLGLVFSLLAAVLFTLISTRSYLKQRDHIMTQVMNEVALKTDKAELEIERWFMEKKRVVDTAALMFNSPETLDAVRSHPINLNPYLTLDEQKAGLGSIFLGTPQKEFYTGIDWVPKTAYDPTARPWYQLAVQEKQTVFTDYYIDANTKNVVMTIASPLQAKTGKILGVVGADISLNKILEKVSSMSDGRISAAVMDQKGVMLAHPEEAMVNQDMLKDPAMAPVFQTIIEQKNGHQFYQLKGVDKVMAFRQIPATGWFVLLFVETKVIEEPLSTLFWQLSSFTFLGVLAFVLLTFWIATRFASRIQLISKRIGEIAEGDLNVTVDKKVLEMRDEIGDLAQSLDRMVTSLKEKSRVIEKIAEGDLTETIPLVSEKDMLGKSLQKMTHDLNRDINTIASGSQTLIDSSGKMGTISEQVTQSTQEISNYAETVASATDEITASLSTLAAGSEEMSANIQTISATSYEMSQNMTEISNYMEGLSGTIQTVSDKSKDALDIANEATEKADVAREIMNALNRSAHEIGEVTAMIKEIAQQTNLLALNANIEAASAGEAGRGFAVVANEIKELARQSSNSAEDIAQRIGEIQENTDRSVASMQDIAKVITTISESSEDITRLAGDGAETVETASSNIRESALGTADIAKLISEMSGTASDSARSFSELSGGAKEISRNLGDLNNRVSQTASNMTQINSEFQNLNQLADDLNSVVGQFKTRSN